MKKFANTARLVQSSKVWLNTIPTRDCDVLMTLPAKTDDATLMWVLSRLRTRTPELVVHVRHHASTGFYGFYLTANYENLLKGAEELNIRKPVKEELGGGTKDFVYDDQDCFDGVTDPLTFLTSQERQSIVQNMLYNLRAVKGDEVGKVKFVEGQAIIPILESKSIVKKVIPLHNSEDLAKLQKTWVQSTRCQPLDDIMKYFGVKISMYFAYLGHYTKAITFPAFIGLIFFCLSGHNQDRDDVMFVLFALVNVCWSTLYLEHWKRRSSEYAYRWGTLDREDELLAEPRPLFKGTFKKSYVTGRLEPVYPAWKRHVFRLFVTLPVIIACLCGVCFTMWTIFRFQDMLNKRIKAEELHKVFKFVPKIMLAVSIGIQDDIYKKIAFWLNDQENYRLDEQYETHLMLKIVAFQFINSYAALFYIAFYVQDYSRLKETLAALLIVKQVIGNIKEALVPWVVSKLKVMRLGYKINEGRSPDSPQDPKLDNNCETQEIPQQQENGKFDEIRRRRVGSVTGTDDAGDGSNLEDLSTIEITESGSQLTQAEIELTMKTYEDTFEDYLEMLIQFGYVTLFSCAFPLAALCALLNNVIEIRSDAFKLCVSMQRPFGAAVDGIGVWMDGLEVMSVIAVMVNCALIGMSGLADRMFPGWGTAEKILLIIILEHLILAMRGVIAFAIPDVPLWVAEEKARLEFVRREALKNMEKKEKKVPKPQTEEKPSTPVVRPVSAAAPMVRECEVPKVESVPDNNEENGHQSKKQSGAPKRKLSFSCCTSSATSP